MWHSETTIAIPPGATIREQLENRGMKQKEFAQRMDLSEKHVSRLIHGQVELTMDVALRLESVLGLPASFWNNLESFYREKLARVSEENSLQEDAELSKQFPYAKMAELGWVPKTRRASEKAIHLRRFFEVAKLGLLAGLRTPGIAYRKTGENEKSDYSLAAWAQKAKLEARNRVVSPIDMRRLEKKVPTIRQMTCKPPEVFSKELEALFADCGVALIFLPQIGGSFLHGATFIDGKKIVMGLTVRGKYADIFWFSLFHEIHHILSGCMNDTNGDHLLEEQAADRFAMETLIPQEAFSRFIEKECFSKQCIVRFAGDLGIGPGIVVGRLQKQNYLPYNRFNDIRDRCMLEE